MSNYQRYKEYNRKYNLAWFKRKREDPVWHEAQKAKAREYHYKNIERRRVYDRKRIAEGKKKNKGIKLRFKVLSRDGFACQYCGRKAPEVKLHVDHVLPKSKGGLNDLINLVTACIDCNLGKADVLLGASKEEAT